jgi:hypothetical protein
MDLYLSLLPAVVAPIPLESPLALASLHESLLESLLDSLLGSLLDSPLDSLLERAVLERAVLERAVLERAVLREEESFPGKAFGRWKTLSLWKLWLLEGSKSVKALMLMLT